MYFVTTRIVAADIHYCKKKNKKEEEKERITRSRAIVLNRERNDYSHVTSNPRTSRDRKVYGGANIAARDAEVISF